MYIERAREFVRDIDYLTWLSTRERENWSGKSVSSKCWLFRKLLTFRCLLYARGLEVSGRILGWVKRSAGSPARDTNMERAS